MPDLGVPGIADPVEIGRGGFGVVYSAVEVDLDRTVAVKVLPSRLDDRELQRFDRERRALGVLSSHPHIVTVYRTGAAADGSPFIVMEFLSSGSTADRLKRTGPYPWTSVLDLGIQLSGAVETAHRHGVLHRDIKPGNVLINSLTGATLADFGIARLKGAPETQSASITASIAHAPPEIIDGHRPGPTADVYSLASTLYELLAGAPAHARPDDSSMVPMLARVARDPIPPLPEAVCPPALFAVLERAMSKTPAERHQAAEAFGEDLVAAQAALGQPVTRMLIEGSPPTPVADDATLHVPAEDSPLRRLNETEPEPPADFLGTTAAAAPVVPPPTPPPVVPTPPAAAVAETAAVPTPGTPPTVTAPATSTVAQPAVSSTPSTEPPASSDERRTSMMPILLAAVFGLAVVGALGAWLLLGGDGDDGDGTTTPTTVVTDPRTVVEALSADDALLDYPAYRATSDPRDAIRFEVPEAWATEQTRSDGDTPLFRVSTDVDSLDDLGTPGLAISASPAAVNPAVALFDIADCTSRAPAVFDSGGHVGRSQLHTECGGTNTARLVVATEADSHSVLVVFQLIDERDLSAVNRLFETLSVDPELL